MTLLSKIIIHMFGYKNLIALLFNFVGQLKLGSQQNLHPELQIYMGEVGKVVPRFRQEKNSGRDNIMKHVKITAFDCPDAWFQALNRIWREGDAFQVGYGSEITETKKLNLTIEIKHPENRPLVSDKAPCDIKYVQGYALEYLWCGEKHEDETYT